MSGRKGILIHPEELDDRWTEQVRDAKLDMLGLHPVGGVNAADSLERAVAARQLPETRRLFAKLASAGITVEYEAHAMGWLLPRSLFTSVPEFFRMDENGERTPDRNLCVSNEDALEYIGHRAETLARLLDTPSDRYFFWLDDVKAGSCHCPKCRGLSASDQQMLAVNAMLKGVRRYNSRAKMSFLAYYETNRAPVTVGPEEGVFLEYAPFLRDHHRPMFDPYCAENASEIASVDELLCFFGKKDSQVLEYWMDNSKFSGWKKPPKRMALDKDVMRQDVREYRAHGFENITSFGCYLGKDYRELYGEAPVAEYGKILNEQ